MRGQRRQIRDMASGRKREARYSVFLSVHHRKAEKHVTLHKLPCDTYSEHKAIPPRSGTYTLHKDHSKLDKAIESASKLALNWHAGIRTCKECWKK